MHLTLHTVGVLDNTGDHCKQRIVLATTNVLARMEVRAALANENLACVDSLAGKTLAAEPLSMGVTTVTAGT